MKILPKYYDTIIKPIITEKSTIASSYNTYTFEVHSSSNKKQIKRAVEAVFSVEVLAVNTMNIQGKIKRFRGKLGKRNNMKKAMVKLKPGFSIDIGLEG